MGHFDLFFFSLLSTILIITIQYHALRTSAQTVPTYSYHICSGSNFTANSTYQTNLNTLLSSLSSSFNTTTIKNGYKNDTVGQNPNTVYGSFQCRGDITLRVCQDCIDTAVKEIKQTTRCPNSEQAYIWYDECFLRYSNQSFFNIVQDNPGGVLVNVNNIENPNQFNQILGDLLDNLVTQAVSNGGSSSSSSSSSTNFASGQSNFTNFQKVYGLVQCTSDTSNSDCNRCLRGEIGVLPSCCGGKQGGRVLRPNCYFRYEIYPFFQDKLGGAPPPQPSITTSNNTTTTSNGTNKSKLAIYIVVPSGIAVLATLAFWCFCFRRKKAKKTFHGDDEILSAESLQFNFKTIRTATDDFSEANLLGEGGFGSVYKGKLLNGQEIAVKRLSPHSGQGEKEFKNEVILVAKLQHRNLARLLGFCLEEDERLLVYEYMPNASLDQFIFDPVKRMYLDWERRYEIIEGIARGLVYLHEDSRLKIIHRDLKASNILLDEHMIAKISDFGMARLFVVDQTQANTSKIVGTYGYMAPEYAMHGQFSVKSDVFSFGVLVLEILSGQKNTSFYQSGVAQDLLGYAWRNWKNGKALEVLDPSLRENCSRSEVMRCIHIALLCVQEDISDRPTMASVVLMLNSYSLTLELPSPPAFFAHSKKQPLLNLTESEEQAIMEERSTNVTWTVNEASITELYPR